MVYNPVTDFIGLWRNNGANVSKLEMPGLDFVIKALARAGVIVLTVSATAPVANQSTTVWLKAAVPSYSAEGVLYLWDAIASAYAVATPALFIAFLEASAGANGVAWWTSTGGAPLNTVGRDGDFAIRTDTPNGIYGPKAAGAWPAAPIPGTADVITSASLDNTFGATIGQIIYRSGGGWAALPVGAASTVLASVSGVPTWDALSALLDAVFSGTRGSILYRGAGAWAALLPGTNTNVLSTGGPGADPAWLPRTPEFTSGTVMVFQQTAAPAGWTKQVVLNDYGLRVVSGAAGTTAGSAFSTVFAQTAVGNTTLSSGQMPAHTHGHNANQGVTPGTLVGGAGFPVANVPLSGSATIDNTGGGGSHTHSVNLALSYVDVIIATKA